MKGRQRFLRLIGIAVLAVIPALSSGQKVQESNGAAKEALPASSVESSSRTAKPMKASEAARVVPPADYRVGVEDELYISVWREQDLSSGVVVRPDGVITFPLLNDVHVVGLTTKELQDLLAEKLKAFVNEPQVTVIVRQIRSRKVYLAGEVPHPGSFPLNSTKSVLQLLAEAGGLSQFAKSGSIYVLREQDGHTVRIPFNYKKALRAGSSYDVTLLPGDMVVVP